MKKVYFAVYVDPFYLQDLWDALKRFPPEWKVDWDTTEEIEDDDE